MKTTAFYRHNATVMAILDHYPMSTVSDKFVDMLKDMLTTPEAEGVSINECKSDGFVVRIKRDSSIKTQTVYLALAATMKKLANSTKNDIPGIIADNYDFDYADSDISAEQFENLGTIDVKKNGRLISIEFDI